MLENHMILGDNNDDSERFKQEPEPMQHPFNILVAEKFWNHYDADRISDICKLRNL